MKQSKNIFFDSDMLLHLNDQEKQNPYCVVQEFFSNYHLQDLRKELWEWLSAGISSDSGRFENGIQRSNLLFLYKNIEKLAEANYLLFLQNSHLPKNKE